MEFTRWANIKCVIENAKCVEIVQSNQEFALRVSLDDNNAMFVIARGHCYEELALYVEMNFPSIPFYTCA